MNKEKSTTFFVKTFGCQMNVNDSEKLTGLLVDRGWRVARDAEGADVVVLNTCAVRERATEKLHTALGRLRRSERPPRVVAVSGCAAQLDGGRIIDRAPNVDVVVGPRQVQRIPDLLSAALNQTREGAKAEAVLALDSPRERASFDTPAAVVAHSGRTRAYVTVMEGCNHVCSFCVVPRTRGQESCRPVDLILDEVRYLVGSGYREVTLLGQTVNAYRWEGMDFAGLLEAVAGISGLERLRFTTSHPEHVDARLADALATGEPICPYVHLPVQSGSDRILARMRRGYTREGYLERVRLLRAAVPGLAVSSDVIVGYPGETDEDFEQTMTLLDEARFDSLFCFTYSPRPGTTAFSEPDDVPALVKRARLARLNGHQQEAQSRRNAAHVGRQVDVLIEGRARDGSLEGRTPHFQIVHLAGDDSLIGRTVPVRIELAGANALKGSLLA